MFLHDPAVRTAYPGLHVGLLLLCKAHRLDENALAGLPGHLRPSCGSSHPVALLCAAWSTDPDMHIGVFDLDRVEGTLTVRFATGREQFEDATGHLTHPRPGEVIFTDASHRVHARRWSALQSPHAALSEETRTALVVVQGVYSGADLHIRKLLDGLATPLRAAGGKVQMIDLGFPVSPGLQPRESLLT